MTARARRQRILFVSHTAEWTGPSKSLLLLLKHLRTRFDTAVLLPGRGSFSVALEDSGIPLFELPWLGKTAIPSMVRLIRNKRFNLVYGNNASGGSRNAFVAAKIAAVPFVGHVREMCRSGGWWKLGYLRFANATIAVSEASAHSVSRFLGRKAPHVVYNGVSLRSFEGLSRDAARAHLIRSTGLQSDATVVIGAAHVCPRKGQLQAVEAIARVADSWSDAHLLLVGALDRNQAYVERVRNRIRELELEDHVSLLGFRRDVHELLRGADIFLHTALADPHPRAVIEGMAAELPVVAYAVDGVSETVLEGETGHLVPSNDSAALAAALARLLGDAERRARLGERGRQRVATHFTAEETARKVGDVIDLTLRSRWDKQ